MLQIVDVSHVPRNVPFDGRCCLLNLRVPSHPDASLLTSCGVIAVTRPTYPYPMLFVLFTRVDVPGPQGVKCHAWLYVPTQKGEGAEAGRLPPIVLMAHGMGGQKVC